MLDIFDITPFSLQDFPDNTSCIIWFAGCNMRCKYCHNPQIVKSGGGKYPITKVVEFLSGRAGLLDGVVLSGGEATLHPDIINLAKQIKDMGFKIKLDTNGTRPKVVKELVDKNLIDFISLDYKAPEAKYYELVKHKRFGDFKETLEFLCSQKKLPFEVRTTVHSDLLNEEDINAIVADLDSLNYNKSYYVQNYIHKDTLGSLREQYNAIDTNKINNKTKVKIDFRNF